jgi:cysteine dioxygenase
MKLQGEPEFPGKSDTPVTPLPVPQEKAGVQVHEAIRTVPELVAALRAVRSPQGYLDVLRHVDISPSQLDGHCRWNDRHYTRNCIVRTADFELLLICYEPGQRTSIHDYDSQEAWVHPVQGSILEERFTVDATGALHRTGSILLEPGSFSHLLNGRSIHRYVNTGSGRACTLNLYAKPLLKWKVYDERSGETSTRIPGQ